MNVIDLFCGCGGLSFGYQEAGCNILLGVDNNETALKTFEKNHPGSKGLNIDLLREDFVDEIKKNIGDKQVDIIIGGPPCQGFSLTGSRNPDDIRNKLYKAIFIAAKAFQPKAIMIENVPGIQRLYGGKFYKLIVDEFKKLGDYNFDSKILYAPDYGVPQIRKRIFIIGIRKDLGDVSFPKPKLKENEYISTKDAIGDLPSLEDEPDKGEFDYETKPFSEYQKLMRKGSKMIHNHLVTKHTQKVKDIISLVPDGGNFKDLPKGIGENRKFNEAWRRYDSNKPSRTIDTGHRNHFHYKYNRVPTVRENARLQSFPDKFIFLGSKTEQYRQVGNAVPTLLSMAVAEEILKIIDKKK